MWLLQGCTLPKGTPVSPYSVESLFSLLLHHHPMPLVLHNGWIDLLFLYHSCYGPLPLTPEVLMADLTEMFPQGIYDTKVIASVKAEDATFLQYLFRKRWVNCCGRLQCQLDFGDVHQSDFESDWSMSLCLVLKLQSSMFTWHSLHWTYELHYRHSSSPVKFLKVK